MITLKDLSFQIGNKFLFEELNCSFNTNKKIGLLGRNGAGKSTLLKLISGTVNPTTGQIITQRGLRIAYLPQEIVLNSTRTVFQEACEGQQDIKKSKEKLIQLEDAFANGNADDAMLEEYSTLQEKVSGFDLASFELKAHEILSGLGFTEQQKNQAVNTLSVGWKMRLVLARLLLTDADFYLFDEPTNHLDMVTKDWFFSFLKNSSQGFLLVSHDRYFLDNSCNAIIELDRGNASYFDGNLSYYLVAKEEKRLAILKAYEQQQREIAQKQATIDRFKASASRADMAKSMMKKLYKIERIEPEPVLPTIRVIFPELSQSGSVVLDVKNISFGFTEKLLFKQVDFTIHRGEKIAIVAANGIGKTTLLNVITDKYAKKSGAITLGSKVEHAIFEQDQAATLDPHKTILEEVNQFAKHATESQVRAFLGSLLFSGDDIYKKTGVLSGGEKNRVALAKVLIRKANFIILDEPTNHLDLYAKEVLVEALIQYKGTLLFVCHDRDVMERVANRVFELSESGIASYHGSYESYSAQKKYNRNQENLISTPEFIENKSNSALPTKPHHKEIRSLESRINAAEKERNKLTLLLAQYAYNSMEYTQTTKKIEKISQNLKQDSIAWEKLTESA